MVKFLCNCSEIKSRIQRIWQGIVGTGTAIPSFYHRNGTLGKKITPNVSAQHFILLILFSFGNMLSEFNKAKQVSSSICASKIVLFISTQFSKVCHFYVKQLQNHGVTCKSHKVQNVIFTQKKGFNSVHVNFHNKLTRIFPVSKKINKGTQLCQPRYKAPMAYYRRICIDVQQQYLNEWILICISAYIRKVMASQPFNNNFPLVYRPKLTIK